MIIMIVSGNLSIINMYEFTTEKKVVDLLKEGRKKGALVIKTTSGKIKVRFAEVSHAIQEDRVYNKNIMCDIDTFINVLVKGEIDASQKSQA